MAATLYATANKIVPTNSHPFVLDISYRFIVRFKFVPDESVPTGACHKQILADSFNQLIGER
jgi:hypothetical protein